MAVRKKGGQYQADFMIAGERHRRSFNSEAEAEAWELQARAAIKLGKPVPEPVGQAAPTLGGRDVGTVGMAVRSAERLHWDKLRGSGAAVRNAKLFEKWVGPKTSAVDGFSPAKVREFIAYLTDERKVSNSTLNRYMSSLSVLVRHADLKERPELPWYKEGKGRVRFFSIEEEQAIIALLSQWGKDRERDLFMFLCDTGLRPWAECTAAEWKQFRGGKICDVFGKNDTYRDVPLTKRAKIIIDRCPRDLPGPFHGLVQTTMSELWDRVREKMPQLHDTVWYTCRHTFASRLVMEGTPLKAVAVLMGNTAAIVDSTYAHLAPDYLADAVNVLDKFGGVRTKLAVVGGDGTE